MFVTSKKYLMGFSLEIGNDILVGLLTGNVKQFPKAMTSNKTVGIIEENLKLENEGVWKAIMQCFAV